MDSLGFGVPDSTKGDLLGGFIHSTYMYRYYKELSCHAASTHNFIL